MLMMITLTISLFLNDGTGKIRITNHHPVYIVRYALMIPPSLVKNIPDIFNYSLKTYFQSISDDCRRYATREVSLCKLFWTQFFSFFIMFPISLVLIVLIIAVAIVVAPFALVLAAIWYTLKYTFIGMVALVTMPIDATVDLVRERKKVNEGRRREREIIAAKEYAVKRDTFLKTSTPVGRAIRMLEEAASDRNWDIDKLHLSLTKLDSLVKGRKYSEIIGQMGTGITSVLLDCFAYDSDENYKHLAEERKRSTYVGKKSEMEELAKLFGKKWKEVNEHVLQHFAIEVEHAIHQDKAREEFEKEQRRRAKERKELWEKRFNIIKQFYKGWLCPTIEYVNGDNAQSKN